MTRTFSPSDARTAVTALGLRPPALRKLAQDRMFEVSLARHGLGPVAGVDEAGRGACAGPIVIAACVLPQKIIPELSTLTDSKALSARARDKLFPVIKEHADSWCVTTISSADIDAYGIQHANISGMRRAVAGLSGRVGYVLTDAMRVPGLTSPHLPMIGGDAAARCIAAASVLAKVTRDRIMVELDDAFPGYGLASHKGYGTAAHMVAVEKLGATPHHRMSYANVATAQQRYLQDL